MRIAISGTIGSGKSEACAYLRRKGYDVFDCDKENSLLLEKGAEGYEQVKIFFPECFDDEKLNKKRLSETVFSDEEKRLLLESIMHPLILKKMYERSDDPLFCEVPLLFEVNWDVYFDHNLLLVCDEQIVRERLRERGYDERQIDSRLKAQMSVEEKLKRAEKIIYNNGSLEQLYNLIDEWLSEIL